MATYAGTVTNSTRIVRRMAPGFGFIFGSYDLTTYSQTGVEITGITGYFKTDPVVIPNAVSDNKYEVRWDATDKCFHAYYPVSAFTPKPALIVEEAVVVTTHIGTLTELPAYIVAIDVTAGTTTGPFHAIPTGETPLTVECAVTFTTGTLTFVSTDAVTAVRVTYFPQRNGTMFDSANLVVDEAVVAAAAKTEFANRAFAVQYVYDNTDNVRVALEPVGEAPSATHTGVIDITNATPTTDIDSHTDDEGNSLKVTYLKYSGLDDAQQAINDADITLSGTNPEQFDFNNVGLYHGLVVPGLGTQLVGEATATNVELIWSGPSATTAAGVPTWHPALNTIRTEEGTVVTTTAIPYFIVDSGVMAPEAVDTAAGTEVASDVDVGAFQFIAFGVVS